MRSKRLRLWSVMLETVDTKNLGNMQRYIEACDPQHGRIDVIAETLTEVADAFRGLPITDITRHQEVLLLEEVTHGKGKS